MPGKNYSRNISGDTILQKSLLCPHAFRIWGWVLFIPGFLLGFLRLYFDFKPAILNLPVFALYYSFFETKYFSFINHNITGEVAGLCTLAGLFMICFSRERIEDETVRSIRAQSLLLSLYAESLFLLISILFIYGTAFMQVLVFNIVFPFIAYRAIFALSIRMSRRPEDAPTSAEDPADPPIEAGTP